MPPPLPGRVSLRDRVAWVPGGGRGIGRSCALALAREGVHVAVSARTETEIKAVAAECEQAGVRAVALRCDATQASEVRRTYARVSKELGPPSILVNAAGVARSETFLKTTPDLMEVHWRLNVLGTFHCLQAALPTMIESGWGRIVNIASVAGKAGAPYIAAYAASKHAVLGLTRSLAVEVASKGVTVNAVCPGYVDTKMTQDNLEIISKKTGLAPKEALERLKSLSPQHRLMQPDEVAAAVLHLCREESAGINGQAITIDGGALQW